jgi:Tfp pilus assembly pilus retraction ATPase PilT
MSLAASQGAGSVLFLVGNPPVMRVGRALQPPLDTRPLTFHETLAMVRDVLSGRAANVIEEHGSVEAHFSIGGVTGMVTVFYGQGSHNLVFHLEE